jgi:enoyl-CoA hydratase
VVAASSAQLDDIRRRSDGYVTERERPKVDFTTIIYRPGPVTRVILNRPDKRNAQSWTLLSEMDLAFGRALADPQCRVIVLSGEGPDFSAGHDLSTDQQRAAVAARQGPLDSYARGLLNREIYTDSHLRWRDLAKPTIAMVHGRCIYGGWMVAAAMDIIFAADDALFVPTYGDYFTTAWDLGPRKAKELLFANRIITAAEAMDWGFVNRVFPAHRLEAETMRYAERVAEQDPSANRLAKFAVNQAQDGMGFTASVRAVGASFISRRYETPERARDGVGAAAGSRSPRSGLGGQFRDRVAQALAYFAEDQG